ncbi:Beta-galactosidase [Posidoniimonas corsicana]|uniref:Beta-galactosidase n=1 Tax=Posidoniimonas corsicana TaxID=1938618 RepID=A0A5C5UUH5_9BACT|nr:glycoside hydrolase family 2 TIM barrel-domain containing protein [Posidoniimonas corsicana]TWT29758.1 Beta-galactosidase [Posidoniimonas corsicana]
MNCSSKLRPLLLLLSSVCLPGAACAQESPPVRELFDNDWRFQLGELEDGQSPELDDSQWRSLDLPHDWSAEAPFDPEFASGTGYLPGGVGWYRKTFNAPDEWQGREVSLHFDGVYRNSEVWLNGQRVGGRPYGYIPFSVRITPHLNVGGENVIAVRVARDEVADSRWYPGTGIYRHVWLQATDPAHIAQWGTFVTTPRITDERADILVSNTVANESDGQRKLRVVSEVVDPSGAPLSHQTTSVTLPAGGEQTLAHWHIAKEPQRWSTDSPVLYTAVTRVFDGDRLVDQTRTPFGVRSYYFDPNEGFFLNGEPTLIKGLCLHHDAGVVGAAVPDAVLERRLRLVKELGANAVRCSHNPMASELYTLCDQIGLLVMDEAFDEWELGKRKWVKGRNVGRAERFGYNEDFEEWAERDAADMVRRGRNHPSIILWSIGNEIDYPGDPYAHPEFFDPAAPPVDDGSPSVTRLAVVAPKLIAAVKRHDPTRPVTMALSNMPASNDIGLANMLDVAGYNYQEQYYEQDHRDFPGRVIYGSENGRGARSWQAVVDNDHISSIYLWVGFDFLGEAGPWPNHGSQAGVFDTRGFLKPYSYQQKKQWDSEPFVRLFVGRQRRGDGGRRRRGFGYAEHPRLWRAEEGAELPVFVVTNTDEVRLTLNGEAVEAERSRFGGDFVARLPYAAGELQVEALSDGEVVATDSLQTPGDAARLQLVADRTRLTADGQDAAHVEVRIVDRDGRLVSDSDAKVTLSVGGAGRLLGVDNGDQNDTTALKNPTKQPRDGRLLAVVQSGREPGQVEVTATAEGLAPATIQLEAAR